MGKRLSHLCILIGVLLMLSSGYLYLSNRAEDRAAKTASAEILREIKVQIVNDEGLSTETNASAPITNSDFLGYLSIPALELELPVMEEWDYEKLKQSPCRFSGSLWEEDLVIMAHNYHHHFGSLSTLAPGDLVFFTDMGGLSFQFQVAAMDILPPTAVAEVTENGYDLTLFTCTYGGKNRIVLYCEKVLQTQSVPDEIVRHTSFYFRLYNSIS